MILVLTMQSTDFETLRVMEWIENLGEQGIRMNAEELPQTVFSLDPEGGGTLVSRDGRTVGLAEVGSVWFRRSAPMPIPELDPIQDQETSREMKRHMRRELEGAALGLHHTLGHATWLSHPKTAAPNKFKLLQRARVKGLSIPETLVTNDKKTLLAFHAKHGEIIIKCLSDPDVFQKGEDLVFSTLTNVFTKAHIDSLPDRFFPVLVQERIEKAFEIRSFYLEGVCYSMAIFSQTNAQTRLDFRRYDHQNPNRTVPFRLGDELEARIHDLMQDLSLNTGSLDLIRATNGKTYFLEVNPLGMFNMVSLPCNMNLEKKVASFLVDGEKA